MHFPYISSTLPRKWKMSSSSTSTTSMSEPHSVPLSPPKATGKPPKGTRKLSAGSKPLGGKRSSSLFRSVSFSEKSSHNHNNNNINNGNANVVMNGEFKVPPPPVLPSASSAISVAIHRPPRPQDFCTKCSGNSKEDSDNNFTSFTRDWRSQSMVDLMRRSTSSMRQSDDTSTTFRSSWTTQPKSIRLVSSSCDGINRLDSFKCGERQRRSGGQPVGLATIFSKNLRSNSWRNLTTIDRVDSASGRIANVRVKFILLTLVVWSQKLSVPAVPLQLTVKKCTV